MAKAPMAPMTIADTVRNLALVRAVPLTMVSRCMMWDSSWAITFLSSSSGMSTNGCVAATNALSGVRPMADKMAYLRVSEEELRYF